MVDPYNNHKNDYPPDGDFISSWSWVIGYVEVTFYLIQHQVLHQQLFYHKLDNFVPGTQWA
jgi:hypothetical protein